jgi:hypothetical protein
MICREVLPEIEPGPIRDCGRITGKQEVIGIGEFLTPLDPKMRISSG